MLVDDGILVRFAGLESYFLQVVVPVTIPEIPNSRKRPLGLRSIIMVSLFVVSTILLFFLVVLDHFPTAAGFQLISPKKTEPRLYYYHHAAVALPIQRLKLSDPQPSLAVRVWTITAPARRRRRPATRLSFILFPLGRTDAAAVVPTTVAVRNRDMADAVKAAMANPLVPSCRCIECEFPALAALNKLGDGSLRSAMLVDDANLAAALSIAKSFLPYPFGPPKVWLVPSRSSSQRLQSAVTKQWPRDGVHLFDTDGPFLPVKSRDVCIFVSPSNSADYETVKRLTTNGNVVVVVNGQAKVRIQFYKKVVCHVCCCCRFAAPCQEIILPPNAHAVLTPSLVSRNKTRWRCFAVVCCGIS
jgi:hypothetical protein